MAIEQRIILGRGTGYKSHADNITFNIIEPNLETLELQWTFFRGVKNDFLMMEKKSSFLDITQ